MSVFAPTSATDIIRLSSANFVLVPLCAGTVSAILTRLRDVSRGARITEKPPLKHRKRSIESPSNPRRAHVISSVVTSLAVCANLYRYSAHILRDNKCRAHVRPNLLYQLVGNTFSTSQQETPSSAQQIISSMNTREAR